MFLAKASYKNLHASGLYGPNDTGETFGFAYICEALDFHIEELRKAIHLQYEANIASKTKPEAAPVMAEHAQVA